MKTTAAIWCVLLALLANSNAQAQGAPPEGLASVRKAFAAAVQSNDRKAVEALTSFPLKNDVFQQPKTIPQAKFGSQFSMYRENLVSCIRTTPLTRVKGSWQVDCDGNILHFGQKGGKWLHTGFENANE